MPYGEILSNKRSTGSNYNTPYKFSAKEKDAETGFNYFGARYYVDYMYVWLSVDPMSDKYPHQSPYMYCSGNPVMKIDPNGMEDGEFRNWRGNYLGNDGKIDNNVFIVGDKSSIKTIKANEKKGATTQASDVKVDVSTNKTVLIEALSVYNRTVNNGGLDEETSAFDTDGYVYRTTGTGGKAQMGIASGDVSIHSHPLGETTTSYLGVPNVPGPDDVDVFKGFNLNIIVGDFAPYGYDFGRPPQREQRESGLSFYGRDISKIKTPIGSMSFKEMRKILKK